MRRSSSAPHPGPLPVGEGNEKRSQYHLRQRVGKFKSLEVRHD